MERRNDIVSSPSDDLAVPCRTIWPKSQHRFEPGDSRSPGWTGTLHHSDSSKNVGIVLPFIFQLTFLWQMYMPC